MGCVSSVDDPDVEGVEWRIVYHDPVETTIDRKGHEDVVNDGKKKRPRRKKSSMIVPVEIDELCKRLDQNLLKEIDPDCLLTSQDMYNTLNDGGLKSHLSDPSNILVIDMRPHDSYISEHVVTALNSDILKDKEFKSTLRTFNSIIVYGDGIYDNETLQSAIDLREALTAQGVCDVFFLVDSYKCFRAIYRFMCTDYSIRSAWERRALQIYPSVILFNQLYQGRGDQASSKLVIENLNISHVINLGCEHQSSFVDHITYLNIDVEDKLSSNILQHLEVTTNFIANAMEHNGCILVHCNLGISRSSAVTLAFLMRFKQWPLAISYEYLKSRRSCISPNPGFLEQLSQWERKLFGSRITNINHL